MKLEIIFSLLKKDFLNLKKNSEVLAVCMLPIMMAIFYKGQIPDNILLLFSSNITLSMIPCLIMAGQIAQEKETNTLYTLRTMGISATCFLISKFIFASIFILIISFMIFIIVSFWSFKIIPFIALTLFASIPSLLIGAVIGISSRNQMQANMVQLPLTLFMMLPVFSSNSSNTDAYLDKFLPFIPTKAYQDLVDLLVLETKVINVIEPIIVILIYSIIFALIFIMSYRRKNIFLSSFSLKEKGF